MENTNMDKRRLSTADLLGSDILSQPVPITDVPQDRETVNASGESYEGYIGDEAVATAVEAGKIVEAANYYGIPHVWKAEEGVYRGCLLQYRAVTESPTFTSATDAAAWFGETYRETDG